MTWGKGSHGGSKDTIKIGVAGNYRSLLSRSILEAKAVVAALRRTLILGTVISLGAP